ncbi:MAG: c-type cytochrome [Gemmatimonadaceae bacterium]|nr:c-type cytochrome [Gemmatimonadaceae bacterium]
MRREKHYIVFNAALPGSADVMQHERRDGTRAIYARLMLTTIALAVACGRGDAPAAADRGATAPPPNPIATLDTTPPSGALGASVRRGRALLTATRDSLPSHVGSALRCFSCHLDEGRRAGGLSLVGVYTRYPQYRLRRGRVDLIEDRVNDCFVRSLNGHAISVGGDDMRDIVTYLWWLARGVAVGDIVEWTAVPELATLPADTLRGARIFSESCARCHGANGEGAGVVPPVWGAKSYNIGAGLARYRMAALFVLHNMPFDKPNTLTPQQALDVSRYIDTRPRPDLAGKEYDWPTGDRPNDVPFPTHPGPTGGADTARTRAHSGAR